MICWIIDKAKQKLFVCPQPYFWKPTILFKFQEKVFLFLSEFSHSKLEQNIHFNSFWRHLIVLKHVWTDKILKLSKGNPYLSMFLNCDQAFNSTFLTFVKKKKKKDPTDLFFQPVWTNKQFIFWPNFKWP